MRDLYGINQPESPGLVHTFDMLLHLLESVDIDELDKLNFNAPPAPVDPEQRAPKPFSWETCRSRWSNAWAFLCDEAYVVTGRDPKNPHRLTLSEDGIELLEELLECRTNPGSPLYIDGDNSDEPVHSNTSYMSWAPDFQARLYQTIGVVPHYAGRLPLYVDTVRDIAGADGSHATADHS